MSVESLYEGMKSRDGEASRGYASLSANHEEPVANFIKVHNWTLAP